MKYLVLTTIILISGFTINIQSQDLKELTKDLDVIFFDGFYDKSFNNYEFTTPSYWMLTENGEPGKDLKCQMGPNAVPSQYFPIETAMLANMTFGDFVVEFNYLQKSRDFSIRDICVLFAWQDSLHYSFAQAASETGKYKNNIFKVEGDRPVKIGNSSNNGVVWNYQKWQRIVVRRKAPVVELYVDDELIMQCSTDAGVTGKFGIGTFGSGFKIDNLKIWVAKEPKSGKNK